MKKTQALPEVMEKLYRLNIPAMWRQAWKEHPSFWFICAYLFFEYARPASKYQMLDVLPWAFLSILLALIAYAVDRDKTWRPNVLSKLLFTYLVVVVIASAAGFSWRNSINFIDLLVSWAVIYFLIVGIIRTEVRFFLFMMLFFLTNLLMSQHGFITWAQRGFQFAGWGLAGGPGWFNNSGEFAIEMCIFLCVSAATILALKKYWNRWLFFALLFLPFSAFMSIIGSSSRGAVLAVGVVGVIMLMQTKYKVKGALWLIVAGALFVVFLPDEFKQRFDEMGEDKTSQQRLILWTHGLEVMERHPLLGIGYANWVPYYARNWPEDTFYNDVVQLPHNILIQAGAELGYTGLFVFLLMVIYSFVVDSRTRVNAKRANNRFVYFMTYGLDSAMIGYLVAGQFVSVLYYPFFWINIALIVALHNVSQSLEISTERSLTEPRSIDKVMKQ